MARIRKCWKGANDERSVLVGRPLFGKDATVGKLKGLMGLGNPNDIANACIYLLSDASRWVTGSNLVMDGGYTTR
jgi:NAD(P)-dependent dehydrogenase (short-subunit alcohol dehydrogenase family)